MCVCVCELVCVFEGGKKKGGKWGMDEIERSCGHELLVQIAQNTAPCLSLFCSPNLKTLHGDSQELSSAIARASELAESVSSKVRVLDLAKVNELARLYLLTWLHSCGYRIIAVKVVAFLLLKLISRLPAVKLWVRLLHEQPGSCRMPTLALGAYGGCRTDSGN